MEIRQYAHNTVNSTPYFSAYLFKDNSNRNSIELMYFGLILHYFLFFFSMQIAYQCTRKFLVQAHLNSFEMLQFSI